MTKSYQDYVINDGKFVGRFEEMYQNCDDPWQQDELDASHNLHKKLCVPLLKNLGIKPQTMIDFGCGKGSLTHYFHRGLGVRHSCGIDISHTAIETARARYPDINFLVGNLDDLSRITSTQFDLIVMSELIWYILPKMESIFQQMKDIVCDNGILMVIQHFYQDGEQKYGTEFLRNYTGLLNIISNSGFEIIYTLEANRRSNHDTITISRRSL